MSDLENKYYSEIAQIRNIIDGNLELTMFLLREHADDVGLISIDEYCNHTGIPKRTVQDRLKKGNIEFLKIGKHRFPCINI